MRAYVCILCVVKQIIAQIRKTYNCITYNQAAGEKCLKIQEIDHMTCVVPGEHFVYSGGGC